MLQIRSLEGFSLLEQHRYNPFPYKASGSVHMQKAELTQGSAGVWTDYLEAQTEPYFSISAS